MLLSIFIFQAIVSSFVAPQKTEPIKGSFLVLDLSMNLTDRPSGLNFEDLTREVLTNEKKPPSFHLKEVMEAVKKAGADSK